MNENMYLGKNLTIKTLYFVIAGFIDTVLCFTSLLIFPLTMVDYSAAALGFFFCLTIAFGILMVLRVKNIFLIEAAKSFSYEFLHSTEPFIIITKLREPRLSTGAKIIWYDKYRNKNLSLIDGAIRKGYLRNCTIEVHAGVPKVALSKKIDKDRCPTCGALITEVQGDTYNCKYCGNSIKRVVVKK